jgi:hypothetical protein
MSTKYYAVIDPHWGEELVIHETIRTTPELAIAAVLQMDEHSMYHGGSNVCVPPLPGVWSRLQDQGYFVQPVSVAKVEFKWHEFA